MVLDLKDFHEGTRKQFSVETRTDLPVDETQGVEVLISLGVSRKPQ